MSSTLMTDRQVPPYPETFILKTLEELASEPGPLQTLAALALSIDREASLRPPFRMLARGCCEAVFIIIAAGVVTTEASPPSLVQEKINKLQGYSLSLLIFDSNAEYAYRKLCDIDLYIKRFATRGRLAAFFGSLTDTPRIDEYRKFMRRVIIDNNFSPKSH
uniref:Uncharacterized protein n=1 Tax=Moniliophthora roreri TaxID=221103 RepID=A0A0W0G2Y2_MONRR